MEKILKILYAKEELKRKQIYELLKTSSKKVNSEISKKIKSFNKIDDFFNHYSNQISLLKLLNKAELNFSKNYDELFSSFNSNIEHYISCLTQIIISIKLILKTQEILNKIFLSSKQCLLKLKNEHQIENISQDNLFSFIENLLDFSETKALKSFSNSSTTLNFSSYDSNNINLLYHQKFVNEQDNKIILNDDFGKTLKILYEEPCTPAFGLKSDKNFENFEKENYQNKFIRRDSSLTLSGEQEINSFKDEKDAVKDKKNNYIIENNNVINKKLYENLLEMINNIYRKGIINSEEKIKLKQLVIAKSKKLESLYYNIYSNKLLDQNVLKTEVTKLFI